MIYKLLLERQEQQFTEKEMDMFKKAFEPHGVEASQYIPSSAPLHLHCIARLSSSRLSMHLSPQLLCTLQCTV